MNNVAAKEEVRANKIMRVFDGNGRRRGPYHDQGGGVYCDQDIDSVIARILVGCGVCFALALALA